jgi:hypothetical protein
LDISAHAKSVLMKHFESLPNSESLDCYYYRPSRTIEADVKSSFEYSSVPIFIHTQTVCESQLQTRVVGEFIEDFRDFYSAMENHGDPVSGENDTRVLLRFLIHSFPLKIEYQTPHILKIVQEHAQCLEGMRISIENALDKSFLGKLLFLDISDPLIAHVGSLILKNVPELKYIVDIDVNQLVDVYRCFVELDFVLENGVDSFNSEFCLLQHEGIKIELAGGYFLVGEDSANLPGLGISLDKAAEDESPDMFAHLLQERRFWMLVRLDHANSQAQISFFSDILSDVERALILESLIQSIKQCSERVNRILLLNNLVCNSFINSKERYTTR